MSCSPSRTATTSRTKEGCSRGASVEETNATSARPSSAARPAARPWSGPRPSRASSATSTAAGSAGSSCPGARGTTTGPPVARPTMPSRVAAAWSRAIRAPPSACPCATTDLRRGRCRPSAGAYPSARAARGTVVGAGSGAAAAGTGRRPEPFPEPSHVRFRRARSRGASRAERAGARRPAGPCGGARRRRRASAERARSLRPSGKCGSRRVRVVVVHPTASTGRVALAAAVALMRRPASHSGPGPTKSTREDQRPQRRGQPCRRSAAALRPGRPPCGVGVHSSRLVRRRAK